MADLNGIRITPRDEDVLCLPGQGCSNKEIAPQLNISPRTVKHHVRTLFLRAGIEGAVEEGVKGEPTRLAHPIGGNPA